MMPESDVVYTGSLSCGAREVKSPCECKKLWKILKEMGIPDHLTCLLRNLYAYGQESHASSSVEE